MARGLVGLAFDVTSNSLYVADRDSGLIHRLDMGGTIRGTFDQGAASRPAAGPSAVPNGGQGLDIASPSFDGRKPQPGATRRSSAACSASPCAALACCKASPPACRSVGIALDGSFADDAPLKVEPPPADTAAIEVVMIPSDAVGRVVLAERAAPMARRSARSTGRATSS